MVLINGRGDYLSRRQVLAGAAGMGLGLLLPFDAAYGDESTVIVSTPSGRLQGVQSGSIRIFRGVSFAPPPVGPLRFRPAVKLATWTGVRDAVKLAPAAVQSAVANAGESEDCLALNIWAPTSPGPHPVFFWVHGGGFTGGRSSDDGAAFAANGIVCITTAYRLGVLGFLDVASLLGEQYRGSANNGLRDLITALEWVHENIGSFGGDPSRVTIGGESAGAKLSDILMGTPSAKPLFRQVISESGGAERVSTPMDADAIARGYGSLWTGMTGTPLNAMLTAPASELIRVQDRFMSTWPKHFPLRPEIGTETLPDYPVHTVADSNARGKHLLIGTNRDESAAFIGPHPTAVHAGDLGNITLDQFETVLAKYAHVYPSLPADRRLIRAVTAEEYWMPSIRLAQATESGHGHAWVYRFDYPAESGDLSGYAFHGLELDFVWNTSHAQADPLRAPLASTIHQAWCSFITRGAPAAPGLPSWPESTSQKPQTMILDATSHVEPNVQADEIALWSGVSNTL